MIANSVSSNNSILAYYIVLVQRTFNIGSTSSLKLKSSWSPSYIYVALQFSLAGILGIKRGTGGLSR
jgi:hypothetical protein